MPEYKVVEKTKIKANKGHRNVMSIYNSSMLILYAHPKITIILQDQGNAHLRTLCSKHFCVEVTYH